MHAKDSNLGNTCRQLPGNSSSFGQNPSLQTGFDLSHQYNARNQVGISPDWRKNATISHDRNLIRNTMYRLQYEKEHASVIANNLENDLFMDASSKEEYMDQNTLMLRLDTQLKKLAGTKTSQHIDSSITYTSKTVSSSDLPQPAFQKVFINQSPDNCSSITTRTDVNVLPNFSVSAAINNQEVRSKSIDNHFPQQLPNNWEVDPIKHLDCYGTVQKNDSMTLITTKGKTLQSESSNSLNLPHVSREFSQVSNFFPGSSSLGDIRQHQHQKWDFQQSLEHFAQPHVHHDKTYMVQPNSSFVNQGEHCRQTLKQPEHFRVSLDADKQFTSGSSAADVSGLDGSANMNKGNSFELTDIQRILLQYFYYKNVSNFSLDLAMKHLHSKACGDGRCTCGRYRMLLLHFDACQDVNCQTCSYWRSLGTYTRERHLKSNSLMKSFNVMNNKAFSDSSEHMLSPAVKRRKMNSAFAVPSINNASLDWWNQKFVQLQQKPESLLPPIYSKVSGSNSEQPTNPMFESISNSEINNNVIGDAFGNIFKNEANLSRDLESDHIPEEPDHKSNDVEANSNLRETVVKPRAIARPRSIVHTFEELMSTTHIEKPNPKTSDVKVSNKLDGTVIRCNSIEHNLCDEPMPADKTETVSNGDHVKDVRNSEEAVGSNIHTLCNEPMPADIKETDSKINNEENIVGSNSSVHILCTEPMPADVEGIQSQTGFTQDGINGTKKVMESKADHEKEPESSNPTVNTVSLTDFFTCNQITEHIASLRKQFNQSTKVEGPGVDAFKCELCEMGTLRFAPLPLYCFCCGIRIKRNSYYYYGREDDTQHCFCTVCYRSSRGGNITFNGTSVSKTDLDKKTNNGEFEEPWVECSKCKSWQHQICALYNDKRDLDNSAEYTCPICRLQEIENGIHVPLPKNAMFGAKDLPSTMLSDHIERRLFKRLKQESEDWAKVEGNANLDGVLLAENLSVRVVLSVEKQLKVKKQFLDIFVEESYPTGFPYTSKVILLFQQIEGVDVCLFAMYVQEFGSECCNPNKRSVYISYLDSVKYFRPQRATMNGEALRTFIYHEILIGYLDFCKKRGFTTCYIWACPPIKGEDYIIYCHPDTQKTPKKDKLRHWYLSMLRKAAKENIVVGLTNIYDNFFVSTGNWDSKVTAARLPYFDGDFWSAAAMDKLRIIEQESGGDYEKMLKLVPKRTLKAMGHVDPSKGTTKDILVMQKLGQAILPFKEDLMVVQLRYVCMHCHEVILSGARWFCPVIECKKFQECERCHTDDSHTSLNGDKHTLCQVLMDDILCDTKENDVILDNGLFDTRHTFLSFCQKNRFQFDSLRRAKYSSMMILYFLKNPTLLNVGTICRVCNKQNVYQSYWKCENCPEFTVCSACYDRRGSNCHAHRLIQISSTALSPSGNQELNHNLALIQQLQDVIKHASQCHSTKTQPCTYPHCLQLKKLFSHSRRCTIRVSGGCQYCKKVWVTLAVHSRNCRDSGCRIPRCMDLKKQAEWIAMQSESRRRAAVLEGDSELSSLKPLNSIIKL